jgi:flagellar biosynthetic protein FliR
MQIAILPEISAIFVLVFARVGTMVMLMPGIGERFVFSRARLSLAFFIALMVAPMVRPLLRVPSDMPGVVGLLASEVLIGLVIGLCSRFVMACLQSAGAPSSRRRWGWASPRRSIRRAGSRIPRSATC